MLKIELLPLVLRVKRQHNFAKNIASVIVKASVQSEPIQRAE